MILTIFIQFNCKIKLISSDMLLFIYIILNLFLYTESKRRRIKISSYLLYGFFHICLHIYCFLFTHTHTISLVIEEKIIGIWCDWLIEWTYIYIFIVQYIFSYNFLGVLSGSLFFHRQLLLYFVSFPSHFNFPLFSPNKIKRRKK